MKQRVYQVWFKITVGLLLVATATTFLVSSFGGIFLASKGFYKAESPNFYESQFCADLTSSDLNQLMYGFCLREYAIEQSSKEYGNSIINDFLVNKKNFYFKITDEKGAELLSNYEGQKYGFRSPVGAYTVKSILSSQTIDDAPYSIHAEIFVAKDMVSGDRYYDYYKLFNLAMAVRYPLFWVLGISFVLSVILFIIMMCLSGRRLNREGIHLTWFDKIPFDLLLGVGLIITTFYLALCSNLIYDLNSVFLLVIISVSSLLYSALAVIFFYSLAARIKYGKFWRNTIVVRIIKFIANKTTILFDHLPILWKSGLVLAALSFVEFILFAIGLNSYGNEWSLFLWMLLRIAVIAGCFYVIIQLARLKKGAELIAGGDLNNKIDTRDMRWDIKKHGESLNNIGDGLAKAVDERMKSERFKTELITNVSHDIKTPLTSIINYVDLLSKEQIQNENAAEYIEVLRRQSAKLKKLTEDLLEASKASAGTLTVNKEKTNISELLGQSIGEYEERFKEKNLIPILTISQECIPVLADGRLLWRVFDNLLGNICKYSQQGTRIYIDVTEHDNRVMVVFKNISSFRLNITADELMERFVRGDSSRSTEGSGLGLSIAKSLTELQNGTFEMAVDGDLFKTIITFNKLQ